MKASKGYTLMEMVVVLALLSLMVGVGIGSFRSLEQYKFNRMVEHVKDAIAVAQYESSTTNDYGRIQLAKVNGGYYLRTYKGDKKKEEILIPPNVEICIQRDDAPPTPEGQVGFQSDESPVKAFTIQLKHKGLGKARRITTRVATGKITLYHD